MSSKETILHIAELAGVSATTVSMVMNGKADKYRISTKTQQRVQAVIDKVGFVPNQQARSLRTKRTATLALIVPDMSTHYFSHIAKVVDHHARNSGYSLFVVDSNNSIAEEEKLIESLRLRAVDGFIIASTQQSWEASLDVPVVFLDRAVDKKHSLVATNNEQATYDLCSNLIKKRIIDHRVQYIGGDVSIDTAQQRWRGFSRAVQDYNIDVDIGSYFAGRFEKQWAYQAMGEISNKGFRAGAIFMAAQMLIEGVLDWWKENGAQIPDDIYLCGFDDHPFFDYLTVPLSTVAQDIDTLARSAVDVLMQHIENPEMESQQCIINAHLRVRHT